MLVTDALYEDLWIVVGESAHGDPWAAAGCMRLIYRTKMSLSVLGR